MQLLYSLVGDSVNFTVTHSCYIHITYMLHTYYAHVMQSDAHADLVGNSAKLAGTHVLRMLRMLCTVMHMQILYNLVGNSAKFTTDGCITVMLKPMPCTDPAKEFVQLSVRDTGCGISKEKQRDMFVPFGQVHWPPFPYPLAPSQCRSLVVHLHVASSLTTLVSRLDSSLVLQS